VWAWRSSRSPTFLEIAMLPPTIYDRYSCRYDRPGCLGALEEFIFFALILVILWKVW